VFVKLPQREYVSRSEAKRLLPNLDGSPRSSSTCVTSLALIRALKAQPAKAAGGDLDPVVLDFRCFSRIQIPQVPMRQRAADAEILQVKVLRLVRKISDDKNTVV
jgi:hypothetical protein